MNNKFTLIACLSAVLGLTACGSDSDSFKPPTTGPEVGVIHGPFTTGTVQARTFAYFDVDTLSIVELTEEQAATDTSWDIAFKGTGVFLNTNDSDNDKAPVSLYFTGNNSEFFDAEGNAVVDTFINATADGELDDFVAVTSADIPANEEFLTDDTKGILDDFYNYNATTHQVTAADEHYYIVNSDTTLTKYRITTLTQAGYGMSDFTISFANQLSGATEFDTITTELMVDAATECSSNDEIYVDFDVNGIVTSTDAWDIKIPCLDDNTGADFTLTLADDATAIQDFTNNYDGIPVESISYYGFKTDQYTVLAFKNHAWYKYSLEGNHKIWSQYGVYLVKNANGVFKLQITSYYDTDGNSGNYSFRVEAL
ncbi:MAG: hypothetical protein COA59_02300 [Colwellia sp.]|nr:MAG: hypothetical protein COA59_02300 [Colwellia sp.]